MENKKPLEEVDLLLLGGTAITVDADRRVIRDAGIAIKGEEIVSVNFSGVVRRKSIIY